MLRVLLKLAKRYPHIGEPYAILAEFGASFVLVEDVLVTKRVGNCSVFFPP